MKNQQRPTPRTVSDGSVLTLHSVFQTIQGEGPHAGRPAVFVRLAGCNLQCPLCDTEYTEGARDIGPYDLADMAEGYASEGSGGISLIVITGGEPFRQNIGPLMVELLRRGYEVQVETNGMLFPQGITPEQLRSWKQTGRALIVVSPKTHKLDPTIADVAAAFKYVVTAGEVAYQDALPTRALGHPVPNGYVIARPPHSFKGVVYVQPADEDNEHANAKNMEAAVYAVLVNAPRGDYRLCLQLHKYAGLA